MIQAIKDFFTYLKRKLSGNKQVTLEVVKLENQFIKLLQDAKTDTKTKETAQADGKSYSFDSYDEKQIKNLGNSKRIVLYEDDQQFKNFVETSKNINSFNKKLYFGKISKDFANLIFEKTGIQVEKYNCSISSNEIRKIFKDHGDEHFENQRGQRAVGVNDVMDIPKVLLGSDNIQKSSKEYNGKPAIIFSRKSHEKFNVVAVVSDKHLDLFVQTVYINIKKENLATPIDDQASINTPEASRGTVSNKQTVPQSKQSVNAYSMQNTENNAEKSYDLDSESKTEYNNNDNASGNGGKIYARTDEFRRLQAESRGLSDREKQLYHRKGKEVDTTLRGRLSGVFKRQLDANGSRFSNDGRLLNCTAKGNNFNLHQNVDGSLFHDIFEIARNYLPNGELVDLHDIASTDDGVGYHD